MSSKTNKVGELTLISLFIAMALVLSYVENLIPIRLVLAFPGIKLGLANIITLLAIGRLRLESIYLMVVVRIAMASIFIGSIMSFWYSIAGGLLSLTIMLIAFMLLGKKVSMIGISALGGIFHNVGQLIVLGFITKSVNIPLVISPKLILAGLITGIFMGYVAHFISPVLDNARFYD